MTLPATDAPDRAHGPGTDPAHAEEDDTDHPAGPSTGLDRPAPSGPPSPSRPDVPTAPPGDIRRERTADLRKRLVGSVILAAPVLAVTVVPPLRFEDWPWLAFALTGPVVVWGGAPFHRAAWDGLRRGRPPVDVLVSLSLFAGSGWSAFALLVGSAAGPVPGAPWWTATFVDGTAHVYLAATAALALAALGGRFLAARDDRPSPSSTGSLAALRAGPGGAPRADAGSAGRGIGAGTAVVAVLAVAAATLGFWGAAAGPGRAAWPAIAVLVVACPGGLTTAAPVARAMASRRGSQLGVALDGPRSIPAGSRVDTVVMDGAGTLTTGRPVLLDVVTADGTTMEEALCLVGGLAARSDDPVVAAVAAAARARGLVVARIDLVVDRPGVGVRAVVDDRAVVVGGERFLADHGAAFPAQTRRCLEAAESAGRITRLAAWDGVVRAVFVVADPLRPDSVEAVAALRTLGVRPILLTGANRRAADALADATGIDEVVAPVLPDEQAGAVRLIRGRGRCPATLRDHRASDLPGDGVQIVRRDGPRAAPRAGAPDLWSVADLLRLCRTARRIARQNLILACLVQAVGVVLAAGGRLHPSLALLVVVGSVGVTIGNSLRLRRLRSLRPPAHRRQGRAARSTPPVAGAAARTGEDDTDQPEPVAVAPARAGKDADAGDTDQPEPSSSSSARSATDDTMRVGR